jgi:regulator of protease activity HflC (stomatin/prohibitin superfamily)
MTPGAASGLVGLECRRPTVGSNEAHDRLRSTMNILIAVVGIVVILAAVLAIKIIRQYERGVLFRLGRVVGVREPGLRVIIPFIDVLHRVSLRIVTMPIQSQGIITRDNVSVDISAVAYFRVVDAVKSVIAIENVHAAIDQTRFRDLADERILTWIC